MRTPEQVAEIEDPIKRLKAAATLLRRVQDDAARRRADRGLAVIDLHLGRGVKGVTIYRDTPGLEMSRGQFNKIIKRAPAEWSSDGSVRDVEKKAIAAHQKILALDEVIAQFQEIRDSTAIGLMEGEFGGGVVSNADVARASGLSTARIAQMRTGAQ